jgi:hypothetical protein
MAIWYILWPFDNLVAIWYIFPRFGISCQEKSGNPAAPRRLCGGRARAPMKAFGRPVRTRPTDSPFDVQAWASSSAAIDPIEGFRNRAKQKIKFPLETHARVVANFHATDLRN